MSGLELPKGLLKILGGRAAGGNRNDWFLEWPRIFNGYIKATSFADAVNLIEKA